MAVVRPEPRPGTGSALMPGTAQTIGGGRTKQRSVNRPIWMEEPSLFIKIMKAVALISIVFVTLFPMVYVVAVSFSSNKDVIGGGLILFPRNPTLESYRAIFNGGVVVRALTVSAGLTIVGTFLQMVFTTTMAYGLSKPEVPGSRFALFLVLGALLFSPGLIPSYLLVKELNMIDTYPSLIVPGLIGAFNLIVIRNFFMNLPQELLDAARVDGANDLQVFFRIVLPLSKAVLAVVALFYGVGIWNSFFNAILYLNDSTKWPVQVVLRQYVLMGSSLTSATQFDPSQPPPPEDGIKMAIVVVATVPILIVYPFLQKYFTKGVLTGAIKG